MPRTNTHVAGFFPDALWPEQRVIVELDGRRWHDSPTRFERDRARVARLVAAGYVVLHFTWRRLTREPMAVIAELSAALARHDPASFAAVAA
jgi:very-short-patch-repair endonuclease